MGRRARGWALRKKGDAYQVRFTLAGRRFERSTDCTAARAARARAEELYQEEAARASRGEQCGGPPSALKLALARWLDEVAQVKSDEWHTTLEVYARAHWLPRWQTVQDLTSAAIGSYIAERLRAGASPVTVRKELSGLRRFLIWAKRRGELGELPAWETPSGRSDHQPLCLTADQVELILERLPTAETHPHHLPVRVYYLLMWLTGFRRATLNRIRWDDLDLVAGTVTVRASADKREYDRVLPLHQRAVEALQGLGCGVGLVFGPRDFRGALRAAAEASLGPILGARVGNHTLRHSRLSFWASQSHDLAALQFLAGHRDLASTKRYIHSDLDRARALLETEPIAGKFGGKKKARRGHQRA